MRMNVLKLRQNMIVSFKEVCAVSHPLFFLPFLLFPLIRAYYEAAEYMDVTSSTEGRQKERPAVKRYRDTRAA